MIRHALFAAILVVASSCAVGAHSPRPAEAAPVTMYVGVAGTLQPDVRVFVVKRDGTRTLLGSTGPSGGIRIAPDEIKSLGAVCMLFEKEGFFTGAIWLEEYEFSDPDYIALAEFSLP